MNAIDKIRAAIVSAMESASKTNHTDRDAFSAGRYDGLKEALAILDKEAWR